MNAIASFGRGLAALAFVFAFGAAPVLAASVAEVANLSGPDRQKMLEEGAKKEGEMLWVGSFNEDNAKPIIDSFTAKYPYIKVERVRTDSTKALQRALAELRARTPKVDLLTSSNVLEFKQAKAVQSFKSPELTAYAKEDLDPDGMAVPLYFQFNAMAAYNTDLVTAAEAPKTYEDLLNPKWKDQMVWASSQSSGAPFFMTFLRMSWGEEKALAWLEKLAKQKMIMRDASARTVLSMMVSKEHKIMVNPFLTHVAENAKKKAPIEVVLQDPVPYSATPYLLSVTAPHPHAAMLMIDHLAGKGVQTYLSESRYFPARSDVAPAEELGAYLPSSRGFKKYFVDDSRLSEMMPKTMEIYSRLFE
jgi:ABC-type Fe3+ transport system substrate-binding protein